MMRAFIARFQHNVVAHHPRRRPQHLQCERHLRSDPPNLRPLPARLICWNGATCYLRLDNQSTIKIAPDPSVTWRSRSRPVLRPLTGWLTLPGGSASYIVGVRRKRVRLQGSSFEVRACCGLPDGQCDGREPRAPREGDGSGACASRSGRVLEHLPVCASRRPSAKGVS